MGVIKSSDRDSILIKFEFKGLELSGTHTQPEKQKLKIFFKKK